MAAGTLSVLLGRAAWGEGATREQLGTMTWAVLNCISI